MKENIDSMIDTTPVGVLVQPDGPLIFPGFGQQNARVRYLASVHFMPMLKKMPHQGETTYKLAANKRGEFSLCKVADTQQWIRMALGPDEEPQPMPAPIAVEGVIRDLMNTWTNGYIGDAARFKPGILEIAGEKPTELELSTLMSMEEQFCNALILEGDKFYVTKKGVINPIHHKALVWMDQKREWSSPVQTGKTHKVGAASGTIIPMQAMVDGGVDLIEFYLKHDLDPMDYGDSFVADFIKRRAAKQVKKPS